MYRSTNIVIEIKPRKLRRAGHIASIEEGRSAFKTLTDKQHKRNKSLGSPGRRWEDAIRMNLQEIFLQDLEANFSRAFY